MNPQVKLLKDQKKMFDKINQTSSALETKAEAQGEKTLSETDTFFSTYAAN